MWAPPSPWSEPEVGTRTCEQKGRKLRSHISTSQQQPSRNCRRERGRSQSNMVGLDTERTEDACCGRWEGDASALAAVGGNQTQRPQLPLSIHINRTLTFGSTPSHQTDGVRVRGGCHDTLHPSAPPSRSLRGASSRSQERDWGASTSVVDAQEGGVLRGGLPGEGRGWRAQIAPWRRGAADRTHSHRNTAEPKTNK